MIRRLGVLAEKALPSEADMRQAVGLVAHVFSTPLGEVLSLPLRDLYAWAGDAATLLRRLHGR